MPDAAGGGAGTRARLLCLTGTTGSGKNAIGARVAEELGGEVLSLDSMKVYRGMDIGTAKPDALERRGVPHHLLDVVDPSDRMDLRRFLDLAECVIEQLGSDARPAVCVGGTSMYLTGLLYGVYEGPDRDEGFRRRLREERDRAGTPSLHARLASVDPASAARINPNDFQRIERALEVWELTGRPPSELRRGWFQTPRYAARIYVITWPRDVLRARIDRRVDLMLEAGWIDEVRRIRDSGGFSREAAMALGYGEILGFLDGRSSLEDLSARIKTRTWQFSRRQMTWLKRFPEAHVVVRHPGDDPEAIVARIVADHRA